MVCVCVVCIHCGVCVRACVRVCVCSLNQVSDAGKVSARAAAGERADALDI